MSHASAASSFGCSKGCGGCDSELSEELDRVCLELPRKTLLTACLTVFGLPLLFGLMFASLALALGWAEWVALLVAISGGGLCCRSVRRYGARLTDWLHRDLRIEYRAAPHAGQRGEQHDGNVAGFQKGSVETHAA